PMRPVYDDDASLSSTFERLHILQSEFFSEDRTKLTQDAGIKHRFDEALDKGEQLAGKTQGDDPDVAFARVLRLRLRSDYMALIEKRYVPALSEAKQARTLAEQLLAKKPAYYDAYVAVGAENFFLSLQPAPVRLLLRVS